jgi:DNA mismatch endonuclease (patch repair protein)
MLTLRHPGHKPPLRPEPGRSYARGVAESTPTPPHATRPSPAKSAEMSRVGRRDTAPELALRSELHRRGFRFRVDRAPVADVRSRADLVFGPAQVAVYVDGCFWHSCPEHATTPGSNAKFWEQKLRRNRERDGITNHLLHERGWEVLRIWEHEDPVKAADRVEKTVRKRRPPNNVSWTGLGTQPSDRKSRGES